MTMIGIRAQCMPEDGLEIRELAEVSLDQIEFNASEVNEFETMIFSAIMPNYEERMKYMGTWFAHWLSVDCGLRLL